MRSDVARSEGRERDLHRRDPERRDSERREAEFSDAEMRDAEMRAAQLRGDETAAREDASESSFENIATAIGSRNLMIIIVTMPLVFLAVVTGAITLFGGDKAQTPAAIEAPVQSSVQSAAPSGAAVVSEPMMTTALSANPNAIVLPEGAAISAMELDGSRLAVSVEGLDGSRIVIYDLGAGEVSQVIPVLREDEF